MYVYPRAKSTPAVARLDSAVVAAAIIDAREAGLSKAQAIGPVLSGSDDVETFNRVWDEVERERRAMGTVNPVEYADLAAYKAALQGQARYVDVNKYATGVLAAAGTGDFAALKTKLASPEGP